MFRTTLRSNLATSASKTALRTAGRLGRTAGGKRFASTAPVGKRSWKSGAVRWVAAGAGVWWYNTSDVFAEEPEAAIQRTNDSLQRIQESSQPTIEAIVEEKRARAAERVAEDERRQKAAESTVAIAEDGEPQGQEGEDGMGGLEEEADQQGAFNPETGEINWDCPCLGGMAHGPCGPEFREAFSCFVYSKEEPKGVECIEKFKGMQDCFRQHPEMYGSELEDDEEEVEQEIRAQQAGKEGEAPDTPPATPKETTESVSKPATDSTDATSESIKPKNPVEESHIDSSATTSEDSQKAGDEGGELLPKSAHDATSK
ncbi:related to rabbit histidine-rich calcium-binding protein [Phialocephala subalpina]|uniref:Mitochondrial intermembrane space import and assembly protein 40 n=1 Tax=Phialocephala subalpina TaxID=576137 RepID=A0A1L7XIC8_9HELO|nr:related to rabbit histidine-rich calcium-binding protein [Phialocephala subalpina]